MTNYLDANPELKLEPNGDQVITLVDAQTGEPRYTLSPTTMPWTEMVPPAIQEREFAYDFSIVFWMADRVVKRNEFPPGVNPAEIVTLKELDELFAQNNIVPTIG